MKILKNRVMELSNTTSVFHNHDYDGDNMIAAALHSEEARNDFKNIFVNNNIEFEHRDSLLFDYEHEAIYAAYTITVKMLEELESGDCTIDVVKDFSELREKYINIDRIEKGNVCIRIQNLDKELHLTEWLINRSLNPYSWDETSDNMEFFYLDRVKLTKTNLTKLTYSFYKSIEKERAKEFYSIIHEFDKFLLEIGTTLTICIPSFELEDFSIFDKKIEKYKKHMIQVEPYLAFHQNMILFEDFIRPKVKENPDNILHKVFDSEARIKSVQLLKAASNTGIPTDIYGKAFPRNIKSSLLDGLTSDEYFGTGDSARLALQQRQDAIPKGGELQRKFFFSTGILKFHKEIDDCMHEIPVKDRSYIKLDVQSKQHLKLLKYRYIRVGEEEIVLDGSPEQDYLIGTEIEIRSAVKCKVPDFGICKKCFGDKIPSSEHVGASLGSYIAEGIIQSVLRTHHFGGAFITDEDQKIMTILRRSEITSEQTILGTEEDMEEIIEWLHTKYEASDLNLTTTKIDESTELNIEVLELPYNDDSVKILSSIVSLIDKNRPAVRSPFMPLKEIYSKLVPVMEQNNILSIYFELILSLLFYDEDNNLIKYSDKPAVSQLALKNVIEELDPKLSIFYNFSNRAIANVYKAEETLGTTGNTTHMYNELLDMYY